MLDYDDLETLERYALAPTSDDRRELVATATAHGAAAVTPGQAFLAGLSALEAGNLDSAKQQLRELKVMAPSSDHFSRLAALIALRSWPSDPAATCAYLEKSQDLSFNATAPAAASDGAVAHGQGDAEGAAGQPRLASVMDPALYSDSAVLLKAVKMAHGPAAGSDQTLASLLSITGRHAVLTKSSELDLDLTLDEQIQLLGGHGDYKPLGQSLAATPKLLSLAREAKNSKRSALLAFLVTFLTSSQLETLVAEQPSAAAATPTFLSAVIRKLYGVKGLTPVAAAVAVDAPDAASGTPYSTPLLTAAEADAIRRRVLALCDRLRGDEAGSNVDPERLAPVAARALLPLAETAVQAAVLAAAAAAAPGAGGLAADEMKAKVDEAVDLTSRLVRCLSTHPAAVYMLAQSNRGRPNQQMRPERLGPALPPLPNNPQFAIQLLQKLLQVASDPPALFAEGGSLAGLLDPPIQGRLLAEAMLTRPTAETPPAGVPVDWAAAYREAGGDPADLAERVELEVAGPERGDAEGAWERPDDDIVLTLTHKAVQHISVLVYDIDTEAYYRTKGVEVDMGVDLEGLGATFQFDIPLPAGLPQLHRYRRAVPLPQLKGRRGVWVVEVQGGGLHSRALVRRGGLAAVVRPSPAGLALTLFREDGSGVADPRVWVDGREYRPASAPPVAAAAGGSAMPPAAAAREVVVPYRAARSSSVPAVLVDGGAGSVGFATIMTLNHLTEEYELRVAMHFEPETAAGGGRSAAPLLLQPSLTIGGWAAPLELLQDVTLKVEVDDLEAAERGGSGGSGARQQVFQDWSPGNGLQAAVVQVRLPDRPGLVRASLTARIKRVAHGSDGEADYQDFKVEQVWRLNTSDSEEDQLRDLYLTRGPGGNYLLRLLGRAGEAYSGVPVVVALTHAFSAAITPPSEATASAPDGGDVAEGDEGAAGSSSALVVRRTLVTDSNGSIDLGNLYGITAVAAGVDATPRRSGPSYGGGNRVRRRYCWRLPSALAGVAQVSVDQSDEQLGGSGVGGGFQKRVVFRALAPTEGGSDNAVQCRIPFARLSPSAAPKPMLLSLSVATQGDANESKANGSTPPQNPKKAMATDKCTFWDVSELLHDTHVAVRPGAIEVSGLSAGVYRLLVPELDLEATILVYRGSVVAPAPALASATSQPPSSFGFVLANGLVAPLSESQPLQVLGVEASVEAGVTARLAGGPNQLASAVVHVFITRFETNAKAQSSSNDTRLGRNRLSVAPGSLYGRARIGDYQSGRRLGDEVRYVLERRRLAAEGRVRPLPALVDRPSLLIEAWKVRETTTNVLTAELGDGFACMRRGARNNELDTSYYATKSIGMAAPGMAAACMAAPGAADPGLGRAVMSCGPLRQGGPMRYGAVVETRDIGTLGLAFCPPAVVVANVPVGADGVVHVTSQQLKAAVAAAVAAAGLRLSDADPWVAAGHRLVRLVAYTAPTGIPALSFGALSYSEARTEVTGVAPPTAGADPRVMTALQRPFPAGSLTLERRSGHPLQPGNDLIVADSATAKVQLYGAVPKVWALYGALLSLAPYNPSLLYCDPEASKVWSEFSVVSSWNTRTSTQKLQRYNQLACRELAFFCYCHDNDFFRTYVQPYLRLRLPSSRCCLDDWLAGVGGTTLVAVWGAPHRYRNLTPLERILLAWEEDQAAAGAETPAAATAGSLESPLPRLARLAADMRSRIHSRAADVAAAVAESNRKRFEIALNGPGQEDFLDGQELELLNYDGAGESMSGDDESESRSRSRGPVSPRADRGEPRGGVVGAVHHPVATMATPTGMAVPYGAVLYGAPMRVAAAAPPPPNFFAADLSLRREREAAPAYRPPPATQEWAEAGWYRKSPSVTADPDAISPESEFWADLADHLARGGRLGSGSGSGPAFLPKRLESAGWSFSDALLATAVIGVPWQDEQPLAVTQGTRLILTVAAPTIAYVRQTAALPAGAEGADTATAAQQPGRVLLLQRLLDPNADPAELPRAASGAAGDEDEEDEAEKEAAKLERADGVEVPPGSPLAYGRLYCYAVTLTNTGPAPVQLDVTIQAPKGAVPLGGRPALWIRTEHLAPYGAIRLPLYYFYFPPPSPGAATAADGPAEALCDAYPAAASWRGKIRAVALGQPDKLKLVPVLPPPPAVDLGAGGASLSWARLVSLPATPEADAARLRYLSEGDLASVDLTLVLWRCKDAAFWRNAVSALRRRRIWNEGIWSYGVLHKDELAIRELLPSYSALRALLGPEAPAAGDIFNMAYSLVPSDASTPAAPESDMWDLLSAADRDPHLEYWPLVNARAHVLGNKRVVLNEAVDESWRGLLRRLAAVHASGRAPRVEDLLAAAYFLVLQDRAVEAAAVVTRAEAALARSGPGSGSGIFNVDLQLTYLRAWLALADPTTGPEQLMTAAAAVRQWRWTSAAAATVTTGPRQFAEPKWEARLASMEAALEEAAAIAAGGVGVATATVADVTVVAAADAAAAVKTEPAVLLYDSPEGPRGAVVLETYGVDKVTLNAHFMDLELLFSAAPFETTLTSATPAGATGKAVAAATDAARGQGRFALLRPAWSTTLDLKAISQGSLPTPAPVILQAAAPASSSPPALQSYKVLLQPHQLVRTPTTADGAAGTATPSGAVLLEAVGSDGGSAQGRRASVACFRCDLRVVPQRDKGVAVVYNVDTGVPVAGAYIKAYIKEDSPAASTAFQKDGYTDRRGLFDYWTLTSKPTAKVRSVALFVSHPDLGSTLLTVEPPLH